MRFAIKTSPQDTTWADMLAVWREADDMDVFESAWTYDHFYPVFTDPSGPCLEGWVTLTALAQATRRLRVGTMVTAVVYRHPALLAKMAATLDIVSDGRLELGLGAGWYEQECEAYGIELGSMRERLDRLDEACAVIVSLLSNEHTDFDGQHYRLTRARCEPKPVQRPHPPICIGGSGERRTLRTVARFAQHWNYAGDTPEEFVHKLEVLRGHCEAVGRDPDEIRHSVQIRMAPGGEASATAEQVAEFAHAGADLAVVILPLPHSPAMLEPLAEAVGALA